MVTQTTAFYDKIDAARGKDVVATVAAVAAFVRASHPEARTLLEVGCGTGAALAAFVSGDFSGRGIEADLKLVALARSRVPELWVDPADPTAFDLGERFDVVVSLFGAPAYARVPARLDATLARIAAHLAPGGIAIVEPSVSFAHFRPGIVDGVFVDEPNLKIARASVSKQMGKIGILDYHYLVASLTGVERHFERHEIGLFGEPEYARAFADAGLSFARADISQTAPGRVFYVGRALATA